MFTKTLQKDNIAVVCSYDNNEKLLDFSIYTVNAL